MTPTSIPTSRRLNNLRPNRAESSLQLGECDNVRPGLPVEQRSDGRPVDPCNAGNLADAATGHSVTHVEDELAGDLCNLVVAADGGPIRTDGSRNGADRARTHASSVAQSQPTSTGTPPTSPATVILDGSNYSSRGKEVIAALENYAPHATKAEWVKVQSFVREAAVLAADQSVYETPRLLRILAPFVLWCVGELGLPLRPEIIFAPRTVDAYCNHHSAGTGATYRSALMRVSETLLPEANRSTMTPLPRRTIQPPYSAAEMKKHLAWARGQHTLNNRHKAMTMLAFSAGAGLWPAEIGLVLREDIVADDAGIVISVRGANPRQVPILRQWEDWLLEVAETRAVGEQMFGSSTRGNDKSLLTNFTSNSVGTAPTNARLRATWIVTHIAMATPMKGLFRASGFKQFGNLHHYLAYVDDLDEAGYRALLRGEASS